MIRSLLRQISVTYAVGACLLRLVELVDEALAPPAPDSPPDPPAPAGPGCCEHEHHGPDGCLAKGCICVIVDGG